MPTSQANADIEHLICAKRRVRAHYRAVRESLTAGEVAAASDTLCRKLAHWDLLQEARKVVTYIAFRNEIDLAPLLERVSCIKWIAPRVVGSRLVLHPYDPRQLVRHRYGMLEPSAKLPVVDPMAVDLVLVPGVAFDRYGGRMGFGGGFYDSFLPTTPALRVAVTYDACLADGVPSDAHDQRMDWVVTPTRFLHCAPYWRDA
jgi:5-formyltetrahydrofolate cyclo-ligase